MIGKMSRQSPCQTSTSATETKSSGVDTGPPIHKDRAILFRTEDRWAVEVDPADWIVAVQTTRSGSHGGFVPRLWIVACDAKRVRLASGARSGCFGGAVVKVPHITTLDTDGTLDFENCVSHHSPPPSPRGLAVPADDPRQSPTP